MKTFQPRRLDELQTATSRLKQLVADLALDKLILWKALEGKYLVPKGEDRVWEPPRWIWVFHSRELAEPWVSLNQHSDMIRS